MDKRNSLFRGIINYSISTWVNLVVGFCSVLLTTRLLCPEVYGLVTMFYTITSVLMYIIMLGIDGALIRFYNEPPENNTVNQVIFKSIVLSTLTSILIFSLVFTFASKDFSSILFGIPSRLLTGLVFLYTFCQIIFRYLNISFRMSFRTTKYNVQNILITSLSRLLVIMAAIYTTGFVCIVIILTIGVTSVLFFYLIVQREEIIPIRTDGVLDFSLSLKGYSQFLRYAFFSAPTYIVTYLNLYLGQQIVISTLGAYALGIFASTGAFNQLLAAFRGGFSTYWAAFVFKNYKNEQMKIIQMHNYIVLVSILLSTFMVVFRDVLFLAIGNEFHESKKFFSLLLVLPILTFVMETTDKGISLKNRNEIQLLTHVLSVLTNIFFTILLIKPYGLIGVALANAISGIVLYSMNTFFGQKYYKSITHMSKSIIGIIIILLVLIAPVIFYDVLYILLGVAIINIASFYVFRNELKTMLHFCTDSMSLVKH